MTNSIKVNLFTAELEPLGEFYSPAIPREGEQLIWEGDLYVVKSVIWEKLTDNPAVQLRVEQ